ncbi:TetR/AcrR family transcriptional regulator, partial [Streptococcus danieliae]|nr:TetR/AcrR family transcriptional regulator [Streptococcus danieliae]
MEIVMDTKEKIIEVASYLFFTKGYESTKISEIIDSLDGLTKGAVYHHFKSKEDIFNAVVERIGLRNKFLFDSIKDDETLN